MISCPNLCCDLLKVLRHALGFAGIVGVAFPKAFRIDDIKLLNMPGVEKKLLYMATSKTLLKEIEAIKAREGFADGDLADQGTSVKKRFDKISVKIEDGELRVDGEKKISERVEGLGGEFTYCTLGAAIDAEKILSGETLPDFQSLGTWLYHTATGGTLDPTRIDSANFYLGEARDRHVWLIYRPEMTFLKSIDAALTLSFAKSLREKKPGKPHLVFAAAKFMSNKQLLESGVEFASLPFGLYREV